MGARLSSALVDLKTPLVEGAPASSSPEGGESRRPLSAGDSGQRRCRDVAALMAFLCYWVGMLWIASIAMREGDLSRLQAGMDYDNRLCGVDRGSAPDLTGMPYVYFACLVYGQKHPTVCVDACPSLSGHYVRWYNGSTINCHTPRGGSIPATTYPTMTTEGKCVPSAASLYALVTDQIDDSAFLSVLAGVHKTLRWLFAAAAAAIALSAGWLVAMRGLCRRGQLAPVTITCAIASLLLLAVALLLRAYYLGSAAFAEDAPALQGSLEVAVNTDMSVGLAILVLFLALTVTVALWCGLLQRLLQAGGILAEAAEATAGLPSLVVLLPPLLLVGLGLLFSYYVYVALLLASAGTPTRGVMHYDRRLQYYFAYHTVGLLWTAEAWLHFGFCTAAGIVVRWYFASVERPMHPSPLGLGARSAVRGMLRTLRYSSGSLALGALLVVPGRAFRFFLEHCLHQAQTDSEGKPELRSMTHCCLRCCLDCATRWLQYLSHNAYVLVAVHDLSFLRGARMAFELTMANIGQVALLTAGERLLLTLAKLTVACFCTAGAALAIGMHSGLAGAMDNTNGALLVCFVACFCIADAWLGVYDAAVEAIFLCFLVDREENDGEIKPLYASPALLKYMERHKPSYRLPGSSEPDEEEEAGASGQPQAQEPAQRGHAVDHGKAR